MNDFSGFATYLSLAGASSYTKSDEAELERYNQEDKRLHSNITSLARKGISDCSRRVLKLNILLFWQGVKDS